MALVDFKVARVEPGPAALAFGVVVILTMLAAKSFDPRLIWDVAGQHADTRGTPDASCPPTSGP